jgi:hypothetical protein
MGAASVAAPPVASHAAGGGGGALGSGGLYERLALLQLSRAGGVAAALVASVAEEAGPGGTWCVMGGITMITIMIKVFLCLQLLRD